MPGNLHGLHDHTVRSAAAGRLRVTVDGFAHAPVHRAVAVEDAVAALAGVRAVHAFSRTGSIVVWHRADVPREAILGAIQTGLDADVEAPAQRRPHSADVSNADMIRMGVGAAALMLLGIRRYALARPPLLGPVSRATATGVTVFSGYPFLSGVLRSLRGGRAGTDALVSAATIASLLLRENVVALTVLWLLNIGEFLQDLTLRRTRRAITDLLRGSSDTVWLRLADGAEVQVPLDTVTIGDVVIVHEHVAIPVDGDVIDGDAAVDQSALTGESLPVSKTAGSRVHAGSVVMAGRLVVSATAVGADTAIGRVIARVEEAQHDRAPIQTVGDTFSRRFVPASFALSALTLLATRDARRAPRDDHAPDRLPLCGGAVDAHRDQRSHRQRRSSRHPDQGRLASGGGRPGERGGVRQDRHPDTRSAGGHQRHLLPRRVDTRADPRLRRQFRDPLSTPTRRSRHPLHRRTTDRDSAARGMRSHRRPRNVHPRRRRPGTPPRQPIAARPARRRRPTRRHRVGVPPAGRLRDTALARGRRCAGRPGQPA